MGNKLIYKDHPGSCFEEWKSFDVQVVGGDYFLVITDLVNHNGIYFRFCINGGFEGTHPKTMMAISKLYQAIQEECK